MDIDINNLYNEIKEKILPFDKILNIGINREDLEWDLNTWTARNPEDMTRFKGLTYFLDDDGNIEGYTEYKNGLEDGLDINFYSNGNIQSYCEMIKRCTIGLYCEFDKNKKCILAEIHLNNGKIKQLYKK